MIELKSEYHKFINRFVILTEPHDINMGELYKNSEALIKILNITDGEEFAGFGLKFVPLCGDYTKHIKDITIIDSVYYGNISYAAMRRHFDNMKGRRERFLNKQEGL